MASRRLPRRTHQGRREEHRASWTSGGSLPDEGNETCHNSRPQWIPATSPVFHKVGFCRVFGILAKLPFRGAYVDGFTTFRAQHRRPTSTPICSGWNRHSLSGPNQRSRRGNKACVLGAAARLRRRGCSVAQTFPSATDVRWTCWTAPSSQAPTPHCGAERG